MSMDTRDVMGQSHVAKRKRAEICILSEKCQIMSIFGFHQKKNM